MSMITINYAVMQRGHTTLSSPSLHPSLRCSQSAIAVVISVSISDINLCFNHQYFFVVAILVLQLGSKSLQLFPSEIPSGKCQSM